MNWPLILAVLIVCLAGFIHGLGGFGFGLVAMALLPMLMRLHEAVAVVVLLTVIVVCVTFIKMHAHYSWRQGLWFVVGSCVGTPLGVLFLVKMDETFLRHFLGGVMVLLAFNELIIFRKKVPIQSALAFPIGVVSGGLSGAFNMGGPPAIAFAYAQPWSKEQVMALLQVVFGASIVVRLAMLGSTGLLAAQPLKIGIWSIVPMLFAMALGRRCFARISRDHLKKGAFSFLAVMGLKYLIFA
ncbi:MAG: sulfite exporter TauE/SafE family protein [Verrucomicrobiota bacterium]